MFSQVIQDAINEQINNELFSSYSYLSMAAWCQHEQFTGCAHWMRIQSAEETVHAHKLYDFLLARNAKVVLKPIASRKSSLPRSCRSLRMAFAQEQKVTAQIDKLYELAFQEKAFAALVELEWFITEQVEEEKTAREVVHKFHMVQNDPASLLDLDREVQRQRAPEPAE